jgi:multidrug efflux pump subunit AcrB
MNFSKFFVKHYQLTLVIFLGLIILGVNSLMNMPRSEDPPFNAPIYTVVIIYPGTSPEDMEKLVADPIEEELYQLDDIKEIESICNDGVMFILIEFNYGVDPETKYNDVIREVNKIQELPDDILSIDINRASASDVAILQTALVSETASMEELEYQAEILERQLETIDAVKWVRIQGVPERNIRIELDLDRMALLKIGLNQVLGLIQANNVNIPGGDIDLGQRKYNIKTTAEFERIEDISNTIIKTTETGKVTRLSDIANVYQTEEENSHIVRYNGQRGIWVITAMKDNRNIVHTREQIDPLLQQFEKQLPEQIKMAHAFDQEVMVSRRLEHLGRDFLIAVCLVLLTLLPLGTRASLVVMISIPLSLSIGIFLLDILGYTLNQLSIVGMVVSLGLLVDDSIVVVENIERYMRKGIPVKEAAVTATNHILLAILGCTATLVLAFLPLANLPESSGDFIRSMPIAVILTVLASLFVSITIIPFLASRILKPHSGGNGEGNVVFKAFKQYINDPYQRLLGWSIKHPVIALVSAAAIFGSSLLLIPQLGFSLFPASEKPMFIIDIETEPGSNMQRTNKVVHEVEQHLASKTQIKGIAANVGMGNPRIFYNEFQAQPTDYLGQILVFLDDNADVPEIDAVADQLRSELVGFPGAKIEVRRFQQGEPVSAPVEMRIIGEDMDSLKRISADIEKIMKSTEGTIYVNNQLKTDKTQIKIDIDRDKSGLYGLTTQEVATTVRMAIAGLDIGKIRRGDGGEDILRVSIRENTLDALENFNRVQITTLAGTLVPLRSVATISFEDSPSLIRHYNKERYSLVSSFTQDGYNTEALTSEILDRLDAALTVPDGYRIVAAGEREARQRSFGGIGTIIVLAVFGLLAILILEFRTIKSTLIVLSVIPLGMVGALTALWIAGETLSFVATVGLIALAGIEIKNSILMVDYTNSLREKGVPLYEAVMDGAETRFLPILLTALTAIGGMTPLVLDRSPLISPLAIVLIGGLISSLILSRVVTPVLYYLIPPRVDLALESEQP